jgi:hypothetical protein
MNAHRTCSGLIAVVLVAAACGSSPSGAGPAHHSRPASITLHPGTYRFAVGHGVHVGERIRCFTRSGAPAGGGAVPPEGHGVGSSTGFEAETADGLVRITCPADPGNA